MKLSIQIFLLFFTLFVQAQDFKPYKIKSGKIVYEKLKYSTVTSYSGVNGVETGSSKQIPYTAEQVIYYWDNFGDIAFEESYQVSEFGGKALPEKVRIGERCWIDEQCYYFDAKENIVAVGPYYQIMDSWIETQYMGAEKSGTKNIMGEKANYYKIDTDQDIYAWKGLILKEDDFSTNSKGDKRYDIEKTKIAVEIDTINSIDKSVFNPLWLVRKQTYQSFDRNKIDEYLDSRLDILEQADNVEGIKIRTNDILLFVTTDNKLGKMQVLNIDENNHLNIKYTLYDQTNEVSSSNKKLIVENNAFLDIDNEIINETDTKMLDFKWRINNNSNLFPQNNIGVYLLKASCTSTF